jgi:thiamine monophosphate kinase
VTATEQRQIAALFTKIDNMQKVVVDGQTETNRQLSALTTRIAVIETKMPYLEEDIKQAQSLAQDEVTGVHNVGYQVWRKMKSPACITWDTEQKNLGCQNQ